MKVEAKFKCYDCGKTIKGKPNVVIRHAPWDQDDSVRVAVCDRCQHGIRTSNAGPDADREKGFA